MVISAMAEFFCEVQVVQFRQSTVKTSEDISSEESFLPSGANYPPSSMETCELSKNQPIGCL
jgi:hypothetical protein